MKAVLLAPEFAARDGGVQRILRLYLAAMAEDEAHHELALVALHDRAEDLARHAARGGPLRLPLRSAAAAGSRTRFLAAAWQASSAAARLVCGHVHLLPVAALAARPGARLALGAHGIEVWSPLRPLRRLALRRADRVYCVSHYTRDRLAGLYPWLGPRLRVVPNALDPALLSGLPPALPRLGAPPVVLCVGRLVTGDAYKGYELLLRAFAALPEAGVHAHPELAPRLRFVGEGDLLPRLRALAAELGVAARVEFAGRLDDAALRQAFADCTCFALPSTGEGFGLVYLEALAAGRPCVGVRAAAVPELLRPELGLLAPPDDVAALAAALAECLHRFWDPAALRRAALVYDYPNLVRALRAAWA
jgi:phosphatidyl-myo-inositol dimannoside synthase